MRSEARLIQILLKGLANIDGVTVYGPALEVQRAPVVFQHSRDGPSLGCSRVGETG